MGDVEERGAVASLRKSIMPTGTTGKTTTFFRIGGRVE